MGSYVIELFPNVSRAKIWSTSFHKRNSKLNSPLFFCRSFIQAKFLFMVRDGRATVNSIISRKVTITGFDLTSYRQCMTKWNHAIETMHNQCKEIGSDKCMMVSVLLVRSRKLIQFLCVFLFHNVRWTVGILWKIGSTSRRMDAKNIEIPRCAMERFGIASRRIHQQAKRRVFIKVSIHPRLAVVLAQYLTFVLLFGRVERSSDQVIKPVNLEALTKWVGQIPDDVVRDMAEIAPMLSVLGYDPYANPPDYGKADSWVKDNTLKVRVVLVCGNNSVF